MNMLIRWAPTAVLHGVDSQGQWRTAQAKEYPPRLSAAIAGAMLDSAIGPAIQWEEGEYEARLEELSQFQPLLDRFATSDQQFGADYVDSLVPVDRFSLKWQTLEGEVVHYCAFSRISHFWTDFSGN